jgi:hypothetical protein
MKLSKKGKRNKSPGLDGISHEFFIKEWEMIKTDLTGIIITMYKEGLITNQQKQGIIVCPPKIEAPVLPDNYRLLTLLNTDYKLLMRIIANRIHPWLEDVLHRNQYCGRMGSTIFDATATARDIIAYAQEFNKPVCLLKVDLKDAFDSISHLYLFNILREHGFSASFCSRIRRIYDNATSIILINGHRSLSIRIRSGVRQGCPLSMILFTLCINPLLIRLDKYLTGVKLGRNAKKTTAIAYADDITIILTKPEETKIIPGILQNFVTATAAKINKQKSHAIALN